MFNKSMFHRKYVFYILAIMLVLCFIFLPTSSVVYAEEYANPITPTGYSPSYCFFNPGIKVVANNKDIAFIDLFVRMMYTQADGQLQGYALETEVQVIPGTINPENYKVNRLKVSIEFDYLDSDTEVKYPGSSGIMTTVTESISVSSSQGVQYNAGVSYQVGETSIYSSQGTASTYIAKSRDFTLSNKGRGAGANALLMTSTRLLGNYRAVAGCITISQLEIDGLNYYEGNNSEYLKIPFCYCSAPDQMRTFRCDGVQNVQGDDYMELTSIFSTFDKYISGGVTFWGE